MPTTAKATPHDDDLVCPLCTETMIVSRYNNGGETADGLLIRQRRRRLAIQRDCCQNKVCQSCLYRHVHSVLEEGIAGCGGAGRSTLTCPLGCGREMTDTAIRACFHGQHVNEFWNYFFGPFIVYPLCLLLIILFPFRCCHNMNDNDGDEDDDYFVLRHKYWVYCHSTRAEQNDVRQYERWSLAIALRNIQRQEGVPTMHCPSPNCDYAWLVASPAYRESKLAHERRKVYLWYTPPKPEEHSSNKTKKKNGDDDNFDDWCQPEFLNMSRAYKNNNSNATLGPGVVAADWLSAENNANNGRLWGSSKNTDGRYMCCAKCHVSFCGLCRQPWRFGSKCHGGISCRAYQRQLPAALQENGGGGNGDAFAFVSNGNNDGRCCPGCSMFTSRTGGCNHMTCPCGVEWCYVCEQPWNTLHYGCVDRPAGYNNGVTGCIIS